MVRFASLVGAIWMSIAPVTLLATPQESRMLKLHARSRQSVAKSRDVEIVQRELSWEARNTALVVVDMWDRHWCKGAANRVAELARPMNKLISECRNRGVLIVHCPSTCIEYYEDTLARKRAADAPYAKPPIKLATSRRWGTTWDWPDAAREPEIPIDDSDMGCDCEQPCMIAEPWKRQIETIAIDDSRDAITHDGQELYNLCAARGIENVIVCGVHLNMCVLGRPFAIRQLVKLGKNVVLVRDMTDTMYNHRMKPFVDHFAGTNLVIDHIETYWCPSIESTDIVGGKPFRFMESMRSTLNGRD
jgi:nicotinamidase-related amidase